MLRQKIVGHTNSFLFLPLIGGKKLEAEKTKLDQSFGKTADIKVGFCNVTIKFYQTLIDMEIKFTYLAMY